MNNSEVLNAKARPSETKAKHLLKEGLVPGSVCGLETGASASVVFSAAELRRLKDRCIRGLLVELLYNGSSLPAVVREVSRRSVSGEVIHISLQVLQSGRTYDSTAHIVLLNKLRTSGYVIQTMTDVPYTAAYEDMTDTVVFDLSKVPVGSTVFVKDLPFAQNTSLILQISPDMPVASVRSSKSMSKRDS